MFRRLRHNNERMYIRIFRYIMILLIGLKKKVNTNQNDCSNLEIKDPLWPKQWYLNRSIENTYDHNVLPAWMSCINGSGIVIGIVDGGIYNNIDLNVRTELQFDPFPGEHHDRTHGTRVAGIAASENNGIFGLGVAFAAQIADVRLMVNSPTFEIEAAALTSSIDIIDIYSNSYLHFPDGFSIYQLSPIIQDATRKGVTYGRQGKGSIYVWSTGNGGGTFLADSCAFEGLCNNIDVIAVAGIRFDLSKVSNGERCSAIMISAFTVGDEDTYFKMYTTDGSNNFTEHFGRNSAAVPMISGGIALALQANPNLGYRDIMHLLILTARGDLPYPNNDFHTNGAGLNVSSSFGFGLMDIGSFVEESKHWRNVKDLIMCTIESGKNMPLRYNQSLYLNYDDCEITKMEHVIIHFNASREDIGHIPMSLTSPSGTNSMLVPGRAIDFRDSMEINITSVHFWSEIPFGRWIFSLESNAPPSGILHKWKLFIYGTNGIVEITSPSLISEKTSSFQETFSSTNSLTSTGEERRGSPTVELNNSVTKEYHTTKVATHIPNLTNKTSLAGEVTAVVLSLLGLVVIFLIIIIWSRRKRKEFKVDNSMRFNKGANSTMSICEFEVLDANKMS